MSEAFKSGPWGPTTPEFSTARFQTGSLNIAAEVDRHVELFEALGGLGDKAKARDVFTADLEALAATGLAMRVVPEIPAENMSWDNLVDLMEGKRPRDVEAQCVYDNFWTPGTEKNSLKQHELASRAARVGLRGLLLNADTQTGVDPVLHHLGLPADDFANKEWHDNWHETTQMKEVAKNVDEFTAAHPSLNLRSVNHHDFALEVLKFRLGLTEGEQLLSRGWMRILDLGRLAVDGDSVVGDVRSDGGQVVFDRDYGGASGLGGVGLSAGLK